MFPCRPIKGAADELFDKIPGFQVPRFRSHERLSFLLNNPSSSTELGAQLVAIDLTVHRNRLCLYLIFHKTY
jgi:hypothetical protein